jgi:hypothetical protein
VKRLDIFPKLLVLLIESIKSSLKELYLNQVYLKLGEALQQAHAPRWIGHENHTKPDGSIWVAQELRDMQGLSLEVLRATGLGYDDYRPATDSTNSEYDLIDSTGANKSFDQRFVEASLSNRFLKKAVDHTGASGHDYMPSAAESEVINDVASLAGGPNPMDTENAANDARLPQIEASSRGGTLLDPADYDVLAYQYGRNTTSRFHKFIDGRFYNHNDRALKELECIIEMADRGMRMIDAEINMSHAAQVNHEGGISTPSTL